MPDNTIEKTPDSECPVPTLWRAALKQVADSFILGGVLQNDALFTFEQLDQETATINQRNIESYPEAIGPLSESSWDTSVFVWAGNYWQVLVDLSTSDGETSDLVMHARVHQNGDRFIIEPGLVYVP